MGRRSSREFAAVSGYSSTTSAGSSFRELDDAFLQNQTRIWLGEMLNTRLDEQVHISELLADGELLCEVSKVVWNLLMTKCVELWHLKPNLKGPTVSRKSGGRYMPYSNVDSFLKICKILGLKSIDLFSPSDVVEKRNTRKVCICIRALSKKALAKQLQVPDFDIVTYTLAMPTDMVGYIRRSLESSQSSFSSSSSCTPHKQSRPKYRQKFWVSGGDKNGDACSEESDEADSSSVGYSTFLSLDKLGPAASIHSDLEKSPGEYSSTRMQQCSATEMQQYVSEMQDALKFENGQYKSEDVSESVTPYLKHSGQEDFSSNMSSFHVNPKRKLFDKVLLQNGDVLLSQSNNAPDFDLSFQNDDLRTGGNMADSTAERDYISEYLAFSDSVVLGTDCSSPLLSDGEANTYNFFMGIDAHGSDFKGKIFENGCQRKDSDTEDEVSSTTSMSSILGRVLAMEFDDRIALDYYLAPKDHPKGVQNNEAEENQDKGSVTMCITHCAEEYGTPPGYFCDTQGHSSAMKDEVLGFCTKTPQPGHDEQLLVLGSEDVESSSDCHRGQEKDSHLNDIELFDAAKEEGFMEEKTSGIRNHIVESGSDCKECRNAENLADNHKKNLDVRINNIYCSCQEISVEGDERWYCNLHNEDGVSCRVSNHGKPDSAELLPEAVVHDDFDIHPPRCLSLQEVHPCSSAEVVDSTSKRDLQTCSSMDNGLDCAKSADQDDEVQQHMVDSVAEQRGHTTDERSPLKPRQKLLKTVAKGTAIVGFLFFLLHFSKRDIDENGKAGKKVGQMQSNPDFLRQKKNQGGKSNGTYPAEKLKI